MIVSPMVDETVIKRVKGDAKKIQLHRVRITAILIAIAVMMGLCSCSVEKSPEDIKHALEFEAFFWCQDFVKDRLKAPASADFASFSNSQVKKLTADEYLVVTSVDAVNSFGAKLRSTCVCQMKRKALDDWTLQAIKIQ